MHLLLAATLVLAPQAVRAADAGSATGRDFPKTLLFDEPGIDDEVSLPTLIVMPNGTAPGGETDVDVELDKRLTDRLSVQINVGYTALSHAGGTLDGWQNLAATLKYVVLTDPARERLASVSLIREFGGSGARQIGAAPQGSSTAAINVGQGFTPWTHAALLQPLALTGTAGYVLPDRSGVQQALLSASVQYSTEVLMSGAAGRNLPPMLRPLIPIMEFVCVEPLAGGSTRRATLAPGLIYAGAGFQVAAEALLPLTKSAGTHAGFITQLNVSLGAFGPSVLNRPVFSDGQTRYATSM